MAKADDKKRPIEERIAGLMGRSAFCDIREGVGGTAGARLTDQDIAAALGMVVEANGRLACMALETHYGSTLLHLEPLLRAWDEHEHAKGQSREAVALTRFGGELAIREFASVRYGTPQLAHYAYLICSRRESLQQRRDDALRWLEDMKQAALVSLKRAVRVVMDEREEERAKAAKKDPKAA